MNDANYRDDRDFAASDVLPIYEACRWSSASKPDALVAALQSSHSVISAYVGDRMVGIGNAISDGHLVVYYPHLLVHPDITGRGIGSGIAKRLLSRYSGFYQQMITVDADAVSFYERNGFVRAGRTVSIWIYDGNDH